MLSVFHLFPSSTHVHSSWKYLTFPVQTVSKLQQMNLSHLYPHLKYLVITEPQWMLPVLSRLHELNSLTSVALFDGSADFSLPPQHCPSLRTIYLRFSTHVSFLNSLVLPNVNTLEMLFLRCPLTSDDITVVCSGLRQTTSLRILELRDTTLSPSGAKTLADAIKQNNLLEKVRVHDSTIGGEGFRVLEEVLQKHSKKWHVYSSTSERFCVIL